MRGVVHHRENGAQEWNRHKENEREREMLPTPYLLILGGMFSVFQAIWPPRVAVLFQFGRALLRNQRALSGKPMFWQPYRCTTHTTRLGFRKDNYMRTKNNNAEQKQESVRCQKCV